MSNLDDWARIIERLAEEREPKPALIYDGAETLSVTREQAEAWQFFGLVRYSPEDGPFGIVYRPTDGRTIAEIKTALVI